MIDTKTTVVTKDGFVSVSTGDLFTVWRSGDDCAAASQVASLHSQVIELRQEIERLRETVNVLIADRDEIKLLFPYEVSDRHPAYIAGMVREEIEQLRARVAKLDDEVQYFRSYDDERYAAIRRWRQERMQKTEASDE